MIRLVTVVLELRTGPTARPEPNLQNEVRLDAMARTYRGIFREKVADMVKFHISRP